jgi:hypothetical protein
MTRVATCSCRQLTVTCEGEPARVSAASLVSTAACAPRGPPPTRRDQVSDPRLHRRGRSARAPRSTRRVRSRNDRAGADWRINLYGDAKDRCWTASCMAPRTCDPSLRPFAHSTTAQRTDSQGLPEMVAFSKTTSPRFAASPSAVLSWSPTTRQARRSASSPATGRARRLCILHACWRGSSPALRLLITSAGVRTRNPDQLAVGRCPSVGCLPVKTAS